MVYFEECREFLTSHIDGLDMEDLPAAERVYRIEHSLRVAHYAKEIAETDGYDVTVCTLAGLLHDVGKFESERGADHGRVSAAIAREFLKTLPISAKLAGDICYCIAVHVDDEAGYDYERIPEAEAVSDADNIDRFGVYRIVQALHYDGFMELPLNDKLSYCRKRVCRLRELSERGLGTPNGTQLFSDACRLQAEYFSSLAQELELTLLEE